MKRGRRILAAVLVICMAMGLVIYNDGTEKVKAEVFGDYEYEVLSDGTVNITKYKGTDTVLMIPEKIDNKAVSSIGEYAFADCKTIRKVGISNGVVQIEERAFYGCSVLTEIDIPNSITNIGNHAFANCVSLEKIKIPMGVTIIEDGTFTMCESLTEISVPNGVKRIGWIAFQECSSLMEITIPESVTAIGSWSFNGCKSLVRINIPVGVTIIEENTFNNCKNLKEVYYSGTEEQWNDIEIVQDGNEELLNAEIHYGGTSDLPKDYSYSILSDGTVTITKYTGSDTVVTVPEEIEGKPVTGIGDQAFSGCESLIEIAIPDGVTSIGTGTFSGCTALVNIDFPEGITSIGEEAFLGCTGLTEIELPQNVTSIGKKAFSDCSGLVEISIPYSVSSIGTAAFNQCSSLTMVFYSGTETQWNRITIGENNDELLNAEIYCEYDQADDYKYEVLDDGTIEITEYIGSDTEVTIPDTIENKTVTSIGFDAFLNNSDLEKITIPASIKKLADLENGIPGCFLASCENLREINVDVANENFSSEQGCLFNKQKTQLIRCPQSKAGEYVIPSSVTEIGNDAFEDCRGLTKITIPSNISRIGYAAFCDCNGLKEITLPQNVKELEGFTFAYCDALTEITIPSGVTSIGYCCFSECTNLKSVTIPESVEEIEKVAFYGCNSLRDVYYSGIRKQWEAIAIGTASFNEEENANAPLLNAVIHFSDGTTLNGPQEEIPQEPEILNTRQELDKLKTGDSLSLQQDFQHYLSEEQIDILENCIYMWLADINYAYQYSGNSGVKERIMKKAGIDPQGVFASGNEQAITHISVETKYGPKTFEITLDIGKASSSGSLYPVFGAMHYEVLEKGSIPSDVAKSGQIGKSSYTDIGSFVECVRKASEDALHNTYQWKQLDDGMTAGILIDKTTTEIIGNENGSFLDGTFTIYVKPLFSYSKKVTISCPVDVYVYSMDGKEVGSIIDNKPSGGNQNVRMDVNGDSKSVFLAGNDYYLNLRGTDTGTMKYEVEEIANDEVRRNVQFLELQLKKDMQYEGYVFRPLNIDSDLYALRTVGGSDQEVFYADEDKYYQTLSLFKRIQELSLSQQSTSLDAHTTIQLSASLFPLDASNQNLQWTTDNESVAKVDDSGLVTAAGTGRATVTVSTKDGSFLKQFCVIDVAEKNIDMGGSSGSGSGGSYGSYGGGTAPSVEQEKAPVVVNLHYVLQFQANGGTSLSRKTMTLLAEDCPGIMPKVKRKDYTFKGWYTKQDGGTQVTGDKPLKEAVTLYAQWTKTAVPAKSGAPTLTSKKKGQMQVALKKVSGAAGYQIEYSMSKTFASVKTKEAGASAKTKTISGLKAGKKYYVRVRAYSVDSMKNRIYGAYSTVKSINVKG